ncbi:unnamed protein product [Linum tenue]|uniref:Uncharacterized protein n=1 Tax=Linum tenue TaxID=586396 RepID=A0AAV0QG30_9ROSI|nr:unnamed protein product [Linum tenue]
MRRRFGRWKATTMMSSSGSLEPVGSKGSPVRGRWRTGSKSPSSVGTTRLSTALLCASLAK